MILQNEALKLTTDYFGYSGYAIEIYKYLNQQYFKNFTTSELFKPILDKIFLAHDQYPQISYTLDLKPPIFNLNNKVLVCCSGGLDSVYQALFLRETGYDVYLLHLQNANIYTNGQETKVFLEFCNKFNFKYFMPKISPKFKTEYKKYWVENSFKTTLIYIIAIDYMIANNICYLSSGDDLRLSLKDSVQGINTGDIKEITTAFINSFNVNFLPINKNTNKALRLNYLELNGASDYFYSTTIPGRLAKSLHAKYELKYNIKLDKWNTCSDRKDCMHLLLYKYYCNKELPEELELRCWNILGGSKSADFVFFNKYIPLEQRIKNLIEY